MADVRENYEAVLLQWSQKEELERRLMEMKEMKEWAERELMQTRQKVEESILRNNELIC
eukprot:CAMPEP_0172478488 /NCGR_PEP_ID=MMETSP1066-20121228/2513_1 /TAXON_ID=671091 /ORGANISM="Coscinodiscus wailesii, Strain CCMP2513" /LENGTH=58 /DNA_ID=CAMNT_0013238117 /DNA_START=19 /DNA_END=195 /DNA_ORIENTATION=-